MLEIQKYLRSKHPTSAVRHACEEFDLEVDEKDDLVLFNYGFTGKSKGRRAGEECRGLVLEKPSWNVVAYPFYRFYNAHEGYAAKIDYSTATLQKKLDGSMVTLYPYKGDWHVATRGKLDASGRVGSWDKTFAQYFWETFQKYADKSVLNVAGNSCITMELTGPDNRVITPYNESALTILMGRDLDSLNELPPTPLKALSKLWGIPVVESFSYSTGDHIKNLVKMLPALEEGFVVVDYAHPSLGNFPRVKIKNPKYLEAHAFIGSGFNIKKAAELVLGGGADEFVEYFPEYKEILYSIKEKLACLIEELEGNYKSIKHIESRRDFAFSAQRTKLPWVMFKLRDNPDMAVASLVAQTDAETIIKITEI